MSAQIEIWRIVPGWEGFYEVSDLGRVKSLSRTVYRYGVTPIIVHERILKLARSPAGYPQLLFCRENQRELKQVHRLVCEAFHGPKPSPMHVVAHWDGDPTNNRPDNLRWATYSENSLDRRRHGTNLAGEANPNAKFTGDQAAQIKRRASLGETYKELGSAFKVSPFTIGRLVRCQTYAGGRP